MSHLYGEGVCGNVRLELLVMDGSLIKTLLLRSGARPSECRQWTPSQCYLPCTDTNCATVRLRPIIIMFRMSYLL